MDDGYSCLIQRQESAVTIYAHLSLFLRVSLSLPLSRLLFRLFGLLLLSLLCLVHSISLELPADCRESTEADRLSSFLKKNYFIQ